MDQMEPPLPPGPPPSRKPDVLTSRAAKNKVTKVKIGKKPKILSTHQPLTSESDLEEIDKNGEEKETMTESTGDNYSAPSLQVSINTGTEKIPAPKTISETSTATSDDGWEALWDPNVQKYYFYNRLTNITTWRNPRVKDATSDTHSNESPEDKLSKILANDQHFKSLSTYEKYKYCTTKLEELKNSDSNGEVTPPLPTVDKLRQDLSSIKTAQTLLDDSEDVSVLYNAQLQGKSLKALNSQRKLTKRQIKHFKQKKQEKKRKFRSNWYSQ